MRKVKLATICGGMLAATVGSAAYAQTAAAPQVDAPAAGQVNEVVVTGSRVKAAGLTSTSPLAVTSGQDLKLQGVVDIETALNQLPQVTGGNTQGQSTYGTPGIATVNLRDLGPSRTLVLIDGKRLAPGDPTQPFADLDFIPSAMVSQVEVLTGGASAAYGSDAVAGVVNFKLRRDLDGVIADYQFSGAQADNGNAGLDKLLTAGGVAVPGAKFDGLTNTATLAAGKTFADGRANVTVFASYLRSDPIAESERDYSACGIGTTTVAQPFDTHVCTGSGTSAFGVFKVAGKGTGVSDNPDGTASFVPFTNALKYNSNPLTDLQRADERYNAGLFAHYDLSPAAVLYTDFMFMRDHTLAQIAPPGVISNRTYTINCDNPLLSASQASVLCGSGAGSASASFSGTIADRLALSDYNRFYDITHTDYRVVGGVRGELGEGWSYDVYGQYSRVDYYNEGTNDTSASAIQNALLVRNVNGVPTCISGAAGCAPLDIFQLGQVSQAAAKYVFANGVQQGSTDQEVLSATLNGDLGRWGVQSPWAARPAAVALGFEYRRDAISETSSANILDGDLTGFGGSAPASGSTDVKEVFAEGVIPLASGKPLVHDLSLDLAYRYSDYSLAGGASTYKASLVWSPVRDLSFRGGYNHAIRAPSVVELFTPVSRGSASVTDSCAGPTPTATLAQCKNTGVTAAEYGNIAECSSNNCTTQVGGNLALKPEAADTYTVGAVVTPRMLPNLSLTLDYFHIRVNNLIGTISAPLIFTQCLDTGSPTFCNLIKRDGNGSLSTTSGFIETNNVNTGFLETSGLDLSAAYRLGLDTVGPPRAGDLLFSLNGTWTAERKVSPIPGQPAYDCAGLYGPTCGEPEPKWRDTLRTTWQTPWNLTLSLAWRYIGGSTVDINAGNPVFSGVTAGAKDIADAHIPGYSYFDLAGTYTFQRYTLRFGVNNLAGKTPPVVDNFNLGINAQYGNGNTFPALYDTLGRTIFVGVTAKY